MICIKTNTLGKHRVIAEYATGPRNLLRAVDEINGMRRDMINAYGNIGHEKTWLEIDDVTVDRADVNDIKSSTVTREIAEWEANHHCHYDRPKTRTVRARNLIAAIRSGNYLIEE